MPVFVCSVYMICGSGQVMCGPQAHTPCIPARWLCDGDDDCGDMSDESFARCGQSTTTTTTTTVVVVVDHLLITNYKKLTRRSDSERELSLRRHRTRTTEYNRLVHTFGNAQVDAVKTQVYRIH